MAKQRNRIGFDTAEEASSKVPFPKEFNTWSYVTSQVVSQLALRDAQLSAADAETPAVAVFWTQGTVSVIGRGEYKAGR